MDEYEVTTRPVFPPETSLVNGYIVVAVMKMWVQKENRSGNQLAKGGMTIEAPYGNEVRLAIPYVDKPGELPPNCITLEEMKRLVTNFVDANTYFTEIK